MAKSSWTVLLTALIGVGAAADAHAAETTQIIDPLNLTFTQALGINDAGTVVGYGNMTDFNGFQVTAPFGSRNFTRENFPNPTPPPATLFTQVVGIDGKGDTVGFYVTNPPVGTTSGFLKPAGGAFSTVDQSGFAFNQLLGINQAGTEAAGYSSHDPAGATGQQAFLYNVGSKAFQNINGALTTALKSYNPGYSNLNSQATGVNNSGLAVGFVQINATPDFVAFTDTSGKISFFQAPGAVSTQALGVDNQGDIVGDYTLANGNMYGFFDANGTFRTLDPFGSTAVTANGVNDLAQVVGFYVDANGNTIGFETSVPEPSTWAMMALGFAGLGFAGLRSRRTQRRLQAIF